MSDYTWLGEFCPYVVRSISGEVLAAAETCAGAMNAQDVLRAEDGLETRLCYERERAR